MKSYSCITLILVLKCFDAASEANKGTVHPCPGNSLNCVGNVLCSKIVGAQNIPFPQPKDISLRLEYPQYNLYETKYNIVFYDVEKIVATEFIIDYTNNLTKLTFKYPTMRIDGDISVKIVLSDKRTVEYNDTYKNVYYKPVITIKWEGTENINKNKNITNVDADIFLVTPGKKFWKEFLTDLEVAAYYWNNFGGLNLNEFYEMENGNDQLHLSARLFVPSITCPQSNKEE